MVIDLVFKTNNFCSYGVDEGHIRYVAQNLWFDISRLSDAILVYF